jgi:hypothetical protein
VSNADPDQSVEQKLAMLFMAITQMGTAFFQLSARLDVIREVVSELHPGVAIDLDQRLHAAQSEAAKEFQTLQKMLELFGKVPPGPPQ